MIWFIALFCIVPLIIVLMPPVVVVIVKHYVKRDTRMATLIATVAFAAVMFAVYSNPSPPHDEGEAWNIILGVVWGIFYGCIVWALVWVPSVLIPHFVASRRRVAG